MTGLFVKKPGKNRDWLYFGACPIFSRFFHPIPPPGGDGKVGGVRGMSNLKRPPHPLPSPLGEKGKTQLERRKLFIPAYKAGYWGIPVLKIS